MGLLKYPKRYGYIRLPEEEAIFLDMEKQLLKNHGVDDRDIIVDICTGINFRRSGYNALSNVLLQRGDILYIPSLYEFGNNKKTVKRELDKLMDKGIIFIFLRDPLLNSYNYNNIDIMVYMRQNENKKIKERQRQGIDSMPVDNYGKKYSVKTGNSMGRPPAEYPENFIEVYTLWKNKDILAKDAIEMTGVCRATFYKLIHQYEEENDIK